MSTTPECDTVQEATKTSELSQPRQLRIAVIGCGAVARQFHLPVLAGHKHVELAALVDRNVESARELAASYRVPRVCADASELSQSVVDAAVICTPPVHHARCAIELAARGIHVFVEKPMATNCVDAQAMVAAADANQVVLSVGTFRRLLPSTRLLQALVEGRWLGQPLGFDFAGGSFYGWPAATLGNMRKDWAGGGVLMDIGPHVLDQLLFIFGGEAELLDYADNALGGIETDCELQLQFHRPEGPLPGRVQLSRLRILRNTLQIECERGRLELSTSERYDVRIVPHDARLHDAYLDQLRTLQVQARWEDEAEQSWYEPFRTEIDDWLTAIRQQTEPALSGRSALPVMQLIDDCYAQRRHLSEPWVEQGLPNLSAGEWKAPAASPPRRVLVTGATGFLGCRVAEILHFQHGWQVRALVHNPANAARLARLPVEMVQGDLRDQDACRQIVADCDAIVHCGIGTSYGDRNEIFRVTVDGTRHLAEAARAAGVKRFVHISTMSVHGADVTGTLDEQSPVRPTRGDTYAESKTAAEQAVAKLAEQGLTAVTLRLATVYGPYAPLVRVGPIHRLLRGELVVPRSVADLPANRIYVDNAVEVILRALEAPASRVHGEVFTVSDGGEMTCGEFYEQLCAALEIELPWDDDVPSEGVTARPGFFQTWWRGLSSVAASAEMRALLRKTLNTDPIGRWPRRLLERSPGLESWLRRRLGMDRPTIYERTEPALPRLRESPLPAQVSIDKVERVLDYRPVVDQERGIELTALWIRTAGLMS